MHDAHKKALEDLAQRGRLRALAPRHGADFSSNDYLGLAAAPELAEAIRAAIDRGVPAGAGGSRLLRGNHPEHEALETEAAKFFRAETALFFGGGFMANYALFSALPQEGDLIVYDALVHASVHDGMRASRAARAEAAHNNPVAFDEAIRGWRATGATGRPWIAVESLYSMDGDRAPLEELAAIAGRQDAVLVIDEAHATGVHGPDGRGLGAALEGRENVISLHTCGKALGVMGGLVCGPRLFRDFLVNRGRPFIYATAPSPLVAAGVRAALGLVQTQPERRRRLQKMIDVAWRDFRARCAIEPSGSQIQPVIVGSDRRATALAAAMRGRGFDVRAVRPPTVPEGTARVRVALTLNVDEATVARMIGALAQELRDLDP